jgi:hypothetical protein
LNPAIEVTMDYTGIPKEPVSERTAVFRNIAVRHVTVNHGRLTVSIEGLPGVSVEGLSP